MRNFDAQTLGQTYKKTVGAGLVLQYEDGKYIFALAGTKYNCEPGEIFYCGIGGHLEANEDLPECAHREALEEIGVRVKILSSDETWYLPDKKTCQKVEVLEEPKPLAIYRMNYMTTQNGNINNWIVIYEAVLLERSIKIAAEEVLGLITLTKEQIISGLVRRPTIRKLLDGGAQIIAGAAAGDETLRCYPIGTAEALSIIFKRLA
ncbi:MAG TPA: NUDIX hydrolase [Pyrinomonadaceae bacterium]|jgi:8-oxo-dGTP pyrophosphatase MutT (NUDIX family)